MHQHRWMLDIPRPGQPDVGVCTCGETREFTNNRIKPGPRTPEQRAFARQIVDDWTDRRRTAWLLTFDPDPRAMSEDNRRVR